MRVDAEDQKLAEKVGKGVWFLDGAFYELYQDEDEIWRVNTTWGNYARHDTPFYVLENLLKRGIKLDKRHFDAIELVETLDAVEEDDEDDEDEDVKETVPITAAEEIVQNLFTARTVSDEELAIGFIRNPKTNDVYKVLVQYIGNRSNE